MKNRRSFYKSQAPFSLIELLVVTTILMLLMGIFIPSLLRARQEAQKTNCASNLRQLGIAAKLYTQEQIFYPDAYIDLGAGKTKYWCYEYDGVTANFANGTMADYIQNPELLRCPTFTKFTSLDSSKPRTSSYGINAEYIGGNPEPGTNLNSLLNSNPAKPENIKRPELTVIFSDSAYISGAGQVEESWLFWARYSHVMAFELDARTQFRHNGRAIAVFCDGHCDNNLKPNAILDEKEKIGWLDEEVCERE